MIISSNYDTEQSQQQKRAKVNGSNTLREELSSLRTVGNSVHSPEESDGRARVFRII